MLLNGKCDNRKCHFAHFEFTDVIDAKSQKCNAERCPFAKARFMCPYSHGNTAHQDYIEALEFIAMQHEEIAAAVEKIVEYKEKLRAANESIYRLTRDLTEANRKNTILAEKNERIRNACYDNCDNQRMGKYRSGH